MMRRLAIFLLRCYKRFVSPLLPPMCRFEPTCSVYTMQAATNTAILAHMAGCAAGSCTRQYWGWDPVLDMEKRIFLAI